MPCSPRLSVALTALMLSTRTPAASLVDLFDTLPAPPTQTATALARQDLQQWNTLFLDGREQRRARVVTAQTRIAQTDDGARAITPEGRAGIAAFRDAARDRGSAVGDRTGPAPRLRD